MNSLFARIMAVMLSVILILTVALSLLSYYSLREQRISARLDYLSSEASDIADLAADMNSSYTSLLFQSSPQKYLNWKAQKVNDEFGAYIAVVDRWGRVMDNLQTAYSEDPDFVASLSGEEISAALTRVLSGEQIRVQTDSGTAPTFTVGVPFQQYGTVTGAVLIQTRVQRIQSGMEDLLFQVIGMALLAMALSTVAVWLVVRSMMKPLGSLTEAARAMGEGDFSRRVDESRGDPQLRQLSSTFNSMRTQLQKLEESRREFVANVSHELRSPITSIRGFAEGMAEGVIPAEEHPRYLRLVADESNRLSRLVEDLLALSRLERGDAVLEKTNFDLNEMLRRAIIRRISDLDRKNIEVECDFRTDPCYALADQGRIEQVVINLLDNAIRFTREGGNIRLTTEKTEEGTAVTVWDDGPPIPEEDRDRVFERFFTSDRAHTSGKGTGLGLSICQQIMKMHGRTIRLLNTKEGAAFRFDLDAGDQAAAEKEIAEKAAQERPEAGERAETNPAANGLPALPAEKEPADFTMKE